MTRPIITACPCPAVGPPVTRCIYSFLIQADLGDDEPTDDNLFRMIAPVVCDRDNPTLRVPQGQFDYFFRPSIGASDAVTEIDGVYTNNCPAPPYSPQTYTFSLSQPDAPDGSALGVFLQLQNAVDVGISVTVGDGSPIAQPGSPTPTQIVSTSGQVIVSGVPFALPFDTNIGTAEPYIYFTGGMGTLSFSVQCSCPPVMMARKRATGPCVHLGAATGERVACKTCTGKVELKVFSCALHRECTPGEPVPGKACCATCSDYQAR